MPKFKVQLMTAYCTWEGVEADNEAEAIDACEYPPEFDCNEEHTWRAEKEDEKEAEPL
jgi:hypothetical protein